MRKLKKIRYVKLNLVIWTYYSQTENHTVYLGKFSILPSDMRLFIVADIGLVEKFFILQQNHKVLENVEDWQNILNVLISSLQKLIHDCFSSYGTVSSKYCTLKQRVWLLGASARPCKRVISAGDRREPS